MGMEIWKGYSWMGCFLGCRKQNLSGLVGVFYVYSLFLNTKISMNTSIYFGLSLLLHHCAGTGEGA